MPTLARVHPDRATAEQYKSSNTATPAKPSLTYTQCVIVELNWQGNPFPDWLRDRHIQEVTYTDADDPTTWNISYRDEVYHTPATPGHPPSEIEEQALAATSHDDFNRELLKDVIGCMKADAAHAEEIIAHADNITDSAHANKDDVADLRTSNENLKKEIAKIEKKHNRLEGHDNFIDAALIATARSSTNLGYKPHGRKVAELAESIGHSLAVSERAQLLSGHDPADVWVEINTQVTALTWSERIAKLNSSSWSYDGSETPGVDDNVSLLATAVITAAVTALDDADDDTPLNPGDVAPYDPPPDDSNDGA